MKTLTIITPIANLGDDMSSMAEKVRKELDLWKADPTHIPILPFMVQIQQVRVGEVEVTG